jgi:hypothetical protein
MHDPTQSFAQSKAVFLKQNDHTMWILRKSCTEFSRRAEIEKRACSPPSVPDGCLPQPTCRLCTCAHQPACQILLQLKSSWSLVPDRQNQKARPKRPSDAENLRTLADHLSAMRRKCIAEAHPVPIVVRKLCRQRTPVRVLLVLLLICFFPSPPQQSLRLPLWSPTSRLHNRVNPINGMHH